MILLPSKFPNDQDLCTHENTKDQLRKGADMEILLLIIVGTGAYGVGRFRRRK